MKAVILAGGEGTRLRPLTSNTPKPMMPLANKPMMEHIVNLLAQHGFDEIVVTVAFLANQIRDYFGDGSDFGVTMRYATEDSPLGTAGSVRNAADELDDTFLVISGDVLTDIDLTAFVKAHRDAGAAASIALKHVENPLEFGIVITQPDGTIERFLEKPTWGEVFSDTINTGIYVVEPEVFDFIPEGEVVDFSGDVFPALLDSGHTLHGHVTEGYWEDVGTLEAYSRAHTDVLDGRVQGRHRRLPARRPTVDRHRRRDQPRGAGRRAGRDRRQLPDRGGRAPAAVHRARHRRDREGRRVPRARRSATTTCTSGPQANLRGCVIGRNTDLRAHVRVDEGTVVGDECFIGQDAVINPNVKVYPFKTVESGAMVTSSIVWESRGARTLFGRRGVRGLANVDINPEVAVRLAMAYSTSLPKGSTITTSRDTSRIARALKRAMIAGINLSGVNVEDIELATVPLTRFQVRNSRSQGGITVRLAPGDPDTVEIRFFDDDGRDIDPGVAAQGRAPALPRGLPARVRRRHRRHRVPAPLARVLLRRARARRRHRAGAHPGLQARARLLVRRVVDRDAEPADQARRRGAGGQPVREHRRRPRRPPRCATRRWRRLAELVRVSGSDLGFVIDPEGELGGRGRRPRSRARARGAAARHGRR